MILWSNYLWTYVTDKENNLEASHLEKNSLQLENKYCVLITLRLFSKSKKMEKVSAKSRKLQYILLYLLISLSQRNE